MKFKVKCSSRNIEQYFDILEKYNLERVRIISENPYREGETLSKLFEYITINSLSDLLELQKEVQEELIIDSDTIEIYDYWRE